MPSPPPTPAASYNSFCSSTHRRVHPSHGGDWRNHKAILFYLHVNNILFFGKPPIPSVGGVDATAVKYAQNVLCDAAGGGWRREATHQQSFYGQPFTSMYFRVRMKKGLLILVAMTLHLTGIGQRCSERGQNPETAFPVCGTATFIQQDVPLCGNRLLPGPCDADSVTDTNPFWYKFTCFSSGTLSLSLHPKKWPMITTGNCLTLPAKILPTCTPIKRCSSPATGRANLD